MPSELKDFLLDQIATYVHACRAEKKLNSKIQEFKDKEFSVENDNRDVTLELINELKNFYQKEQDRKTTIETKAAASLFIIGLSVTLILGSLEFIRNFESGVVFKFIVFLILIVGVVYLLFSGVAALKALIIRELYDEDINDRIKEDKSKLNIEALGDKNRLVQFYRNIKLNQLVTNIRSNYVYATFIGIRNGIMLISIFFMVSAGHTFFVNLSRNNHVDLAKIKQLENKIGLLYDGLIQQKEDEIKELNEQILVQRKESVSMKSEIDQFKSSVGNLNKKIGEAEKGLESANKRIDDLVNKSEEPKNK
jgi:chromosome segregation ATPase